MERRLESYLLTPGPVTVAMEVKRQMLTDRSANSRVMVDMIAWIRSYLLEICNGTAHYECVPLQGSATYAVEAVFQTLVPRGSRVLIIENGAYGTRMANIAEALGMQVTRLPFGLTPLPSAAAVEAALRADQGIEYVSLCHVETSTGAQNPIEEIAAAAQAHGKKLIIDAVASFGGLPIDVEVLRPEAVILSPNKCLEAVPGLGIVIARRDLLVASKGRSPSPCLDLHDQWNFLQNNGFFRWTPPTHVMSALAESLRAHKAEGGIAPRNARYKGHWTRLVTAMRARGFTTLLPDADNAPIVTSFHVLDHPRFSFQALFDALERRGVIIFPGNFPAVGTFRIGVMGDLRTADIDYIIASIDAALAEMGVATGIPAE
jgi:2-aminoethylphosphonate-pyruvate transaminase